MLRATCEIASSHAISEFLREEKSAMMSSRIGDSLDLRSVTHSLRYNMDVTGSWATPGRINAASRDAVGRH